MDLALWIIQGVLALAFLAWGGAHVLRFEYLAASPRSGWVRAVGKANLRVIGVLEILGATGLVLPAATGILPSLTPLADEPPPSCEFIAGAEEEWRKRTGRPMTADELERVLRRYPVDA